MRVDHSEETDLDGVSESGSPRVSRRTVLAVGWSTPVILAVAPSVAFAASGVVGGTSHSNNGSGGGTSNSSGNPSDPDGQAGGASGTQGGGGISEQQPQAAEPARINRGFTG